MALRTQGLDEKIMKSAKDEFLKYGYKDASINRIAKNAGATSGAIYIRYKNKDEIFCSLVDIPMKGMQEQFELYKGKYSALGIKQDWEELNALDAEIFDWIIDYMYENYDAFKLLICKSDGSSVSNFASDFIHFKFQKTYEFIENIIVPLKSNANNFLNTPISKEEISLLSSAQYHSLFEVIHHDYSKEEAKKYLTTLRSIYANGIYALLKDFVDTNQLSGTLL